MLTGRSLCFSRPVRHCAPHTWLFLLLAGLRTTEIIDGSRQHQLQGDVRLQSALGPQDAVTSVCVISIHNSFTSLVVPRHSAFSSCPLQYSYSQKKPQNFAKSECYHSPKLLNIGFALYFLFLFFAILSIYSRSLSVFTPPQSISSPLRFSFAHSHLVLYFPCTTVFQLFELGSSCFCLSKRSFSICPSLTFLFFFLVFPM